MPADEDYGRRQQITSLPQHASPSPVPTTVSCPVGCPAAAGGPDHLQQERYASEKALDRFGSERSNSDRLPSGERYQGASERYPLGERPHTSISSERLVQNERQPFVPERYCQRYAERFVPIQNVGSLDRYHGNFDRYQRANTPTDRYHTLSAADKERCSVSSNDRCTPVEGYLAERYTPTERHRNSSQDQIHADKNELYKRPVSSERKSDRYLYPNRFGHEQYYQEAYSNERFPAIPCPERFANHERASFTQVPYMEPPSPAPASDRFIPPPPLSPENASSPDCYPSNPFPSPTTAPPPTERFIPPPPLSPSPTENFSPKKIGKTRDRYQDRYTTQGNSNERYLQCQQRNQYYNQSVYQGQNDKYVGNSDRYSSSERYVPPNAHTPVERYVPQPQEQYYGSYHSFDRFSKYTGTDPYMRRDLAFHYRLPLAYTPNQYQRLRYTHMGTPNRIKCCQYQEGYHMSKSSPGSSSSSSVTSQGKEIHNLQECQNVQCPYQPPEKGLQCTGYAGKEFQCPGYHLSVNKDGKECFGNGAIIGTKGQCRHVICASPSVEYVGQSGGRHVCATPPPRGSIGSGDSMCSDQCCTRRSQNTLTVAIWRGTPQQQLQQQQQQPSNASSTTTTTQEQTSSEQLSTSVSETNPSEQQTTTPSSQDISSSPKPPPVQRAISLPATTSSPAERYRAQPSVNYSQSERLPRERPIFARSTSKKEAIKNFIKKETATFFGVDEESEVDQQQRWMDRRKRLASRTYGPLKDEYKTAPGRYLRRAISDAPTYRTQAPGRLQMPTERPDVLPGPSDMPDSIQERLYGTLGVRGKDSVARMTWDGISYVVSTLTRHRPRHRDKQARWSRSYPPETPSDSHLAEDDVFFDRTPSPAPPKTPEDDLDRGELREHVPQFQETVPINRYRREAHGWKRSVREEPGRPAVGRSRIFSAALDRVLDNSDRRQYGMGWVGRFFGRSMRKSVTEDEDIMQQLDDIEDHRPMFTYWVTTVQILVLIISLICYGFGPYGIDLQTRSGQVLVTSLSLQQVDYLEPANFWFGPRAADLIHLGAKFAPCMRADNKIIQQIDKTKAKERETACCIRNDDSGCVQSSQADCSKTIATWKKWSAGDSGPGGRISGSVCGLDPKFCDAPASVHPYEWPDDITKWPICRKTNTKTQTSIQKQRPKDKLAEHMVCEVIGHPCCIGIHGQCRITTREYCDFVRGTFHEEASLCSQVSCLDDVCGMIPFYFPQTPDQFYRLWTSLFLHAGILQLVITVLIQHFLMRDLEKLTGSLRIGIIYIGSGVAGNLASAIFVPYRADVGPAGSQFGLLACLIVEVLNAWPMLKHPNQALLKLLSVTFFLFLVGLLPWVDNYAHLFGFIFGFLLSYALLPFISFGPYDRQKKIALIWVCLLSASSLFICLVLLFYIIPVYDCKICSYFNCLPITNDFCASQNINFKREEPIV